MDKPITTIQLPRPASLCPACGAVAVLNHTLTVDPPIHVYSCGCRVQYITAPEAQRHDR